MAFRYRLISLLKISFPFSAIHGDVNPEECTLFLPTRTSSPSLPSLTGCGAGCRACLVRSAAHSLRAMLGVVLSLKPLSFFILEVFNVRRQSLQNFLIFLFTLYIRSNLSQGLESITAQLCCGNLQAVTSEGALE